MSDPGWADLWGIDPDYPRGDHDEAAVIRDLADRLDARAARYRLAARSANRRFWAARGEREESDADARRIAYHSRTERLSTAAAVLREELAR